MILLPALAVTFAAFYIWLAVRIVNRRERWAKWTAVALVLVLVAYPLSYPWAFSVRFHQTKSYAATLDQLADFYAPFGWAFQRCPEFVQEWY